ncbi:phosphatase PAP2 family protein [Rugamonas apoptosis]|uniref:Phosphatase PAP2 family protein n=1 Tax=Rugamonas apoptosis TaxID=2758570 RepID=A0A7W2F8M6_9BURK|nr:phosphatase PAP2 family protein [Rugamonas apoptosis]MBA5687102.1 phosphatase PAP2 family protein [Rugamonas apoptosis]
MGTRLAWSMGLAGFWALGYFTAGAWLHPAPIFDPSTALDAAIPFAGLALWPYLFGIIWIAMPAVLLQSPALFRHTARSYALLIAFSLLCFVLLPAEAPELRRQASGAGLDPLTAWALQRLHAIDPPRNLLPSLHVSLAALATCALARSDTRWRLPATLVLAMIVAAVCLSKQHTVADAVAGLLAAWLCDRVARRLNPAPRLPPRPPPP